MDEKAKELLSEAVRADSAVSIIYHLGGMTVTAGGLRWDDEQSTRARVEMEEAIKRLQSEGLLERKHFGWDAPNPQTVLHPTSLAFRELG